jgi:hypothetical protein
LLRDMQNDVDESLIVANWAKFDIPTNEENQEFELKVAQEQKNIHTNRKMIQLRERLRQLEAEKMNYYYLINNKNLYKMS